jgi:hypothetical protein
MRARLRVWVANLRFNLGYNIGGFTQPRRCDCEKGGGCGGC